MHRLCLSALALALAAPALADPVAVTDSSGVGIVLPAPAVRVVTIDKSAYVTLAALGVAPVGAAVHADIRATDAFLPEGEAVPDIGSDPWTPDPELVAAARPDLIVGWVEEHRPLIGFAAPYYAFAGLATLPDYHEALREVGALVGRAERAEALIAGFEARAAAYAALAPARPRTVMLYLGADAPEIGVSTAIDPGCQVLALVVTCDWENPAGGHDYFTTSAEGVLAMDPDVILLSIWPHDATARVLARLASDPLWNEIRAVREGRVIAAAAPISYQADSILGFTQMLDEAIPAIFPETFPGPLTDAEVAAALAP